MKKVTSLLLLAGVAAFGLAGCGDDEGTVGPEPQITSVTVTPSSISIEPGQTAQVRVDFQTQGDVQGVEVAWSSGNTNVATVSPTGDQTAQVSGQASGTVSITATVSASNANSQSGSAGVTVEQLENATLSIGDITQQDGSPVNVSDVSGQINVTVNVEKADEDVSQVSLLVDSTVVSTQDFSSANEQASEVKGQSSVEDVVFNFRTDRLEGSSAGNVITADNVTLDGNVKRGQFDNSGHTISAQLTTSAGDVRTAENSQTLTFNNDNLAITAHLSGGQGVVEPTSGARYWGGEDIQVSITPIIFDAGLSAGSVTISANAGAQTASGNGAIVFDSPTVSSEPFVFDILQADNAGGIEDAQGAPDGLGGNGSDFDVADIRDADGAAVLGEFTTSDLNDFFLDFDAPDQSGSVEFAGVTTAVPGGSVYYSGFQGTGTVTIILPGVSDDGVGGTFTAPSDNFTVDIIDSGTPGSATTLFSDVSATWMLDEQAPSGSGGATDHFAHVTDLADNLGNGVTFAGGGVIVTTPVGDFGIDQTAPGKSNALPAAAAGGPIDAGGATFVFNGDATGFPNGAHELQVDIADPALDNGETPSGTDHTATAVTVFEDASGASFTPNAVNLDRNADATQGDYAIDVSNVADGSYGLVLGFNDSAEPTNGDSQVWNFILDTTAPTFGALSPVPASTSTGATSVILDIGGTISDANQIVTSNVTVFADGTDAQGAGSDGTCDPSTDYELDPATGEIDRNAVDITSGSNSIDFDESFEISDPFPSGSGTVQYCFIVNAVDEALDNTGAAAGNAGAIQTSAQVQWN